MKKLLALGICLVFAAPAMAGLQETVSFVNAPSEAAAGTTTYNMTVTGGYTLGNIDWSGFASTINAGTYGSELTLDLTGPGAFGTQTIALGSGSTYSPGAAFSGITNAFSNIADPVGTWTFDFYESYDDGGDGLADANWDNIDFGFYDYVAPTPNPWPGTEDFENGVPPLGGWTVTCVDGSGHTGTDTWYQETYSPPEGLAYASVQYDSGMIAQQELLLSPTATAVAGMTLDGLTNGSIYWGTPAGQGGTYDNYDGEVWIIRGGAYGGGDDTYVGLLDDFWVSDWTWETFFFDLNPLLTPGEDFQIGFIYDGYDGAQLGLDAVTLTPEPSTLALLGFGALAMLRRRR